MQRPRPLGIVVWCLIVFLYAPLVVAVVFAFNGGSTLSVPLEGLSLRWFRQIAEDEAFRTALRNSTLVAVVASSAAVVIGTTSAVVFARRPSKVTSTLELGAMLPAMIPPLLIGVSLLTTMAAFHVSPSLKTVTVGHLVYVIPFVIVVVSARLRSLDIELEQAARDLGASPLETLRRVTLPALLPAIIGAGLLAFAFSFDEVLITTFTIGLDPTLPMYVISRMRRTIDPSVNAVATILLAVPWIAVLVYAAASRLLNRGAAGDQTTFLASSTEPT